MIPPVFCHQISSKDRAIIQNCVVKSLTKIDNITILDILLSLWIYFQFNRSIACV